MPTEDAYSSGHLVLSHFGTCMCSNVETNLSWTCLVSRLLNFEHPSVLLFCFNFHITNFPFLSSNILSSPAYGVFISQLIRYARACSSYECFILRARRLSSKLLKQGYLVERLKSSFRRFYGRYGDLIQQYEVSLSRMLNDILTLDKQWLPNQSDFPPISWPCYRLWPSPNYEWFPWSICNGCGMPAGNAYHSGHLVPSPFWGACKCSDCWDQFPRHFTD